VLRACCLEQRNVYRGWHQSPFTTALPYRARFGGREYGLGHAEIHVPGPNGVVFVAPHLIYHYMFDKRYLPPRAFRDAVERWPISERP
jgi:hypothetical protein